MTFNHFRPRLQLKAALRLGHLEFFYVTKMAISQGLIGQRPQTFRRLQFGRVRGQKVQMDSCRHLYLRAHMPTRTVEHEQDLFPSSCPDGVGKLSERDHTRGNRHGGQEQPPRPARPRLHEGIEIAPLVAMLHRRLRALAAWAPDAAEDGFEPDAVLVGGPQLHLLLGVRLLHGVHYGREVFLKAACAAGSAFAWRGRGTLEVQPRRRKASHPRWGWTAWPSVTLIQAAAVGPVHTPPSGGGCVRAVASAAR
jgi:hypothetical protein